MGGSFLGWRTSFADEVTDGLRRDATAAVSTDGAEQPALDEFVDGALRLGEMPADLPRLEERCVGERAGDARGGTHPPVSLSIEHGRQRHISGCGLSIAPSASTVIRAMCAAQVSSPQSSQDGQAVYSSERAVQPGLSQTVAKRTMLIGHLWRRGRAPPHLDARCADSGRSGGRCSCNLRKSAGHQGGDEPERSSLELVEAEPIFEGEPPDAALRHIEREDDAPFDLVGDPAAARLEFVGYVGRTAATFGQHSLMLEETGEVEIVWATPSRQV